jgi:predicted DNA-binding protein with PD1-like motif
MTMQGIAMEIGKVHIVRVDPNEDVLAALRAYVQEAGITQAVILGGYGTLATYHLHWVTNNRIPSANTYGQGEGGIEILAMNGTVVAGEPHVHVTLSTTVGAFGGHLEEGCHAYVLCEIYLGEVTGAALKRGPVAVDVPGLGKGTVPRLQFDV